jgi:hypothetical protein
MLCFNQVLASIQEHSFCTPRFAKQVTVISV